MSASAMEALQEVVSPADMKLIVEALLDALRRSDRGEVTIEVKQHRVHSIAVTRNYLVLREEGEGETVDKR